MIQVLTQGIASGMIYALVGIGFVLVYRSAGLFNFAHTESYTIGAMLAFVFANQLGLSYFVAIILAGLIVMIIGAATEFLAFRRLLMSNAPPVNTIVASIALGIILRAVTLLIWGPDAQFVNGINMKVNIGPAIVDGQNILISLVVLVVVAGLWFLLYRTKTGVALRAVADNRVIASVMGIDIRITLPLAFGLAGLLGGIAGSLVAPLLFSQYRMGQAVLIKAFSAGVIGGLNSIPGVIAGGLFIGVAESLVGAYITTSYKNVFAFALLLVILIFRPTGILGKQRTEKV